MTSLGSHMMPFCQTLLFEAVKKFQVSRRGDIESTSCLENSKIIRKIGRIGRYCYSYF